LILCLYFLLIFWFLNTDIIGLSYRLSALSEGHIKLREVDFMHRVGYNRLE
jgi:hypothetical protein